MDNMQAVVLGAVQGLTEFLPISSSAHLRVVPALLGWPDPGAAYSAVIQLGSVVAVLAYFRNDLVTIISGALAAMRKRDLADHNLRILAAILIGTLPVCIIGLLLKHILEADNSPLRSLTVIGFASIFMGGALFVAEKLGSHKRELDTIGVQDGLLVGLGQALALIPGCSRSGSTLTVAMLLNLKRDQAARFSFLLGIPAIILSGLLELKEMFTTGLSGAKMNCLLVGLLVSTMVSYLAIYWLIKYLRHHATWVFIVYRLIFGSLVIYLATHALIR